jgi:hypothetical protein
MADRLYRGGEMDIYIPESWLADGTLEEVGRAAEQILSSGTTYRQQSEAMKELMGPKTALDGYITVVSKPKE